MCIIAIAYRVHPAYPLIIAANRDEFYSRPTAPLHFWPDHPEILAGRDLKSYGTWLGVNKKGKIAAVTNFREPDANRNNGISRGGLTTDYLAADVHAADYLQRIAARKDEYSGFNLIAGTTDSLLWYSNRGGGITEIEPGVHGLSNHLLNTPWPKVEKIRETVSARIGKKNEIDPEDFFGLLSDDARFPDEMLPETGIGKTWESILSPIFIKSDIYGTRCSSVITVAASGKIRFCERRYDTSKSDDTRCFDMYPGKYTENA